MSDEKPRYNQNRRLKQAKMQRQVRQSQRRLARLRVLYKLFLVFALIFIILFILKLPQWRLKSNAFDCVNSPALEILNNHIVSEQKILSALRRNQVPRQPIFLVKTDDLKKSIMQLEPIQNVYIRRFWFPARLQIIIIDQFTEKPLRGHFGNAYGLRSFMLYNENGGIIFLCNGANFITDEEHMTILQKETIEFLVDFSEEEK